MPRSAAALVPLALLGLLFPESGAFPFWFSAWWPLALFCTLALLATRGIERDRDVRTAILVYLAVATLAAVMSNPLGGNMTRLGSLFGGPVLLAILLARRPGRLAPVAVAALVVGLAWQVITPLRQISESLDDPATERSYYQPLVNWLEDRSAHRERIEIPQTFNHWETAYVSPRFSLARGWLRQLDLERNRIFYEGEPTHASYRRWLLAKGIRWVAASDARLDYSAQDEDRLVREEPPYLRLRARLAHWRIYEVVGAAPMLSQVGTGRASLAGLDPESFVLSVERPAASSCGCATRLIGTAARAYAWAGPGTGPSCGFRGRERYGCEPISALEPHGARRAASHAAAEHRSLGARFVNSSLNFARESASLFGRCSG